MFAVTGVVVDERVAIEDANGGLVPPVLVDEADGVVKHRCEGQHAAGADVGQVAGCGVDGAGEVAPFRARSCTGLFHHLEGLIEPGYDPLAYPVHLVGIQCPGEQPVLVRGARLHAVVAHDLGVRPEEQRGLGKERVDPRLVLRGELAVGDSHRVLRVSVSAGVSS